MKSTLSVTDFYEVFREISAVVHASTNVKRIMDLVVWKISEILEAKGAILRIINLETREMDLYAAYGLSPQYLAKGHVSSHKMITELCRKNKVILIEDVLSDPRVQYPQEAWEQGIRMMLDAPLTLRDSVVGIIRILFSEKREFSEEELDFVIAVAQLCACAIDKARLFEEQESRYTQLALQTEKLSALGRMAAGIAHEINNPLSSVLLYSSNAIKKVADGSSVKEALQIIISETIRCRSIIQDLLEFSREKEPQKVLSTVNCVVEKALALLENEFRLRHITVVKLLAEDLPQSLLDVNQMQQVMVNLLLNAVESMEDGGKLTVRTSLDPEQMLQVIEVKDTGCGIPTEHLDRIFEPFFSTKPKGTGLGLAVSYGIVRNHDGDIEVQSEPGKGSRFIVALPVQQDADPAVA